MGQPSFGSRLSCEVGTQSGDVFLTAATPPHPALLPVQQSVQEAENLLESTREARGSVCLFLKWLRSLSENRGPTHEEGRMWYRQDEDELAINL